MTLGHHGDRQAFPGGHKCEHSTVKIIAREQRVIAGIIDGRACIGQDRFDGAASARL